MSPKDTDVYARLGRIEGELETLNKHFSSWLKDQSSRLDGYSIRIRDLEAVANKAKGGWGVLSLLLAVSGAIGGVVSRYLMPR